MRKQVENLMAYLKPECHVVEAATERFVCTSVRPHPGSQEEDWDPDEDVDGGEYEFE